MHEMRDLQAGVPDRFGGDYMTEIMLTINSQRVSVAAGSTVLEAAKSVGITIPTLCHFEGFEPETSCMLCVVEDMNTKALILACGTVAADGMVIETDTTVVRESRKDTLGLLLSEHVGDCEAPCQRTCPANMNIPLMIRQIRENNLEQAIVTVKQDIALPAVLGRICSAPCEKGCHRRNHDKSVSICLLKRYVADIDLAKETPYRPDVAQASGERVAIIGAGPTGLAAAYHLARNGHGCVVFDNHEHPGGMLRYGVPDDVLPKAVLDAEIEQIRILGVEFIMNRTLGKDVDLHELRSEYRAVILAVGTQEPDSGIDAEIERSTRGITVARDTFETSLTGVFAGGNALGGGTMAIRSVAHGKRIAQSVHRYVNDLAMSVNDRGSVSKLGKLHEGETAEFIREAAVHARIEPGDTTTGGFSASEASKESDRCFHCDCRKPHSCKLRRYAGEYGADQKQFAFGGRKRFQKVVQHDTVIFEPGKCIKCHACVEITKRAGEQYGFTFINRGFDVRLAVPFNEPLDRGLRKVAMECVAACPTAALALRSAEEESDRE
jgi:ferredoxin